MQHPQEVDLWVVRHTSEGEDITALGPPYTSLTRSSDLLQTCYQSMWIAKETIGAYGSTRHTHRRLISRCASICAGSVFRVHERSEPEVSKFDDDFFRFNLGQQDCQWSVSVSSIGTKRRTRRGSHRGHHTVGGFDVSVQHRLPALYLCSICTNSIVAISQSQAELTKDLPGEGFCHVILATVEFHQPQCVSFFHHGLTVASCRSNLAGCLLGNTP